MYSALRTFVKRAAPAVTAGQHAATAPNVQSIWLNVCRGMATGPAAGGHISDELLDKLGSLSTQALIDGLWVMGWPTSHIMGARPLTEGQKKMIGRAITIQFAAARPDIAADKPGGTDSPEYEAFELVNGKEVIVMSSVGPWESVGGDIKFLRLFQRGCAGLVTDGSVRDTAVLREYGFPVFSHSTTPRQGPHVHQPWSCNTVINCGGVVVRPGDAIIGDQDGAVVIPASHAQQVYDIAHSREVIEDIVKEELTKNPGPPGKFYPFMSGKIKPDSPLGQLLDSKGVKFAHSAARPGTRVGVPTVAPTGTTLGSRRTVGASKNMSTYTQSEAQYQSILKQFAEHKACAVLRTPIVGACTPAMNAAVDGGFKLVEFTLTTPGCLDSVAEYASRKDVLTGVGTVMTIDDAKKAMDAGAQFIVSPVLIPEVVEWCAANKIVCAPGCQTPSEMVQAWKLGAPIQKLFPGVAGGPAWVRAVSAALPMLRINPTSGVEIDTAADYLRAGASSLGFVAPAFPPKLVENKDWNGISKIAAEIQTAVRSA